MISLGNFIALTCFAVSFIFILDFIWFPRHLLETIQTISILLIVAFFFHYIARG